MLFRSKVWSEALGDINQGKTARKTSQTAMAFTSIMTSSPLSSNAAFAADDTFMGFEPEIVNPNQAIEEAKEQLFRAMEAKEEEDIQQWMEQQWEEQMWEQDSLVRFVDRDLVREVGEHVVVEFGKRRLKVSAGFCYLDWN